MRLAEHTRRSSRCLATLATLVLVACTARGVPVEVTYTDGSKEGFNDPTLGAVRQDAFEAAVSAWASQLTGTQTIRISASFDPLGGTSTSAILGQAGPNVARDFPGAPLASRWYPIALANQLLGADAAPASPDIVAVFNSSVDGTVLGSIDFYYGLDGSPGKDMDFYTVVLHEMAHGLGFSSHAASDGSWYNGFPSVYDDFLARGSTADADHIVAMTSSSRRLALISGNLYSVGPEARAANSDAGIKLFAPNPYEPGSSTAHLDEATYTGINELMTPYLNVAVHDAGPLVPAILKDLGWVFVRPVNALDKTVSTPVNTPVSFNLEATGNGTLAYTITTPPAHGTLTGTDAARTYTPAAGYQGTDTFQFQVTAGNETSNIATVTVNVGVPGVHTVTTNYADGVSTSGATLRGAVNPGGVTLTAWFEWGETPSLGNKTPSVNAGSGTASVPVSHTLSSLTPGKAYYFRLAGSSSKGSFQGEVRYFVTRVPGSGTALEFDGISDYLALDDSSVPETFTVEMWVNPAKTADGQAFIAKNTAAGGDAFSFGYYSGGVFVRVGGVVYDSGTKTTGYQHLAVVSRKLTTTTTEVTVYRNGDMLWQRNLSGVTGAGTGRAWVIGQEWDSNAASDFFEGQMDEVRIWSTARTQTQIQQMMHRRLAGTESGLRAYLRLDDGSGITPRDERGGFATEMVGLPQWAPSDAPIGIPLVLTRTTTNITSSGARAAGTVNPNGLATEYWFEWGTSLVYGEASAHTAVGSGTDDVSVSATLSGLLSGTTYHVRLAASNDRGTSYGADQTFTTVNFITKADVAQALRVAGGVDVAETLTITRLNAVTESPASLTIADAVRLARKAAGLEPNP